MITLSHVTLRRGTKVVLDDASVVINPGEKVGLVGRNGAGKSSLFSLLAGRLSADAGDVEIPPRWLVAEVAQEMPETEQPATDFVLEGDLPLQAARQELAQAEANGDGMGMATAHMHIAEVGGFDARARAQSLLLGLGFRLEELDHPVDSFSGGWRMRLQLARALMCPADLLLLDEPTNHLDLDALVWLESWLTRFTGTLIVISHDREFLDTSTSVTLHLEDARLTRYAGGYSAFEEQHAERLRLQQAAYGRQQDQIAHLQKFIDRFKAKATKARQAQSRVKALERMERVAPVISAASFTFEFKEPEGLPNPMLTLDDVACGYGDRAIVQHINRSVLAGARIGILGANGQGKSTFVKTIAGVLPPVSGIIHQGKGLSIGYFAQQELDILRPDDSALDHMIQLARNVSPQAREQDLRSFLGSFRFVDDMVKQPVGTMSGGEKARLVLAMLVWQRPNLLLLDEPTNHLDILTREALAMALGSFEGTVMLVSHDRAMLRSVCDEYWLVADGGMAPFDGDLDDYQRYLLEMSRKQREQLRHEAHHHEAEEQVEAPTQLEEPSASPQPPRSREERRAEAQRRQQLAQQTRPLRRETEQLETRLAELEARKEQLENQLAQPGLAAEQIAAAGRDLKQVNDEAAAAEERWLQVAEEIQSIEQAP